MSAAELCSSAEGCIPGVVVVDGVLIRGNADILIS